MSPRFIQGYVRHVLHSIRIYSVSSMKVGVSCVSRDCSQKWKSRHPEGIGESSIAYVQKVGVHNIPGGPSKAMNVK